VRGAFEFCGNRLAVALMLGLRAVAVLTGHGSRFTAAVTVP
jgi:hypothetical protein